MTRWRHEVWGCSDSWGHAVVLLRRDTASSGRGGLFHGEVEGAPAGSQILDDLISEHDNERMGPSSGFKAYEDGTHFEVCSFAGTKRLLDRGQIFVAVVDHLFGGLCGRQVGFEHIAAVEFGGFGLRVLKDR